MLRSHPGGRFLVLFLTFSAALSSGAMVVPDAAGDTGAGTAVSARVPEHHHPMTYIVTALANAGYLPAKVIYASLGALVSGGAYIVTGGNEQAWNVIWRAAVEGDYVITPRMIEGRDRVRFIGA